MLILKCYIIISTSWYNTMSSKYCPFKTSRSVYSKTVKNHSVSAESKACPVNCTQLGWWAEQWPPACPHPCPWSLQIRDISGTYGSWATDLRTDHPGLPRWPNVTTRLKGRRMSVRAKVRWGEEDSSSHCWLAGQAGHEPRELGNL